VDAHSAIVGVLAREVLLGSSEVNLRQGEDNMSSIPRLVLAVALASAAVPVLAGWGPGGHDDTIYPEGEPVVAIGGDALTDGPGMARDDTSYAQGRVRLEMRDIQVTRGPLAAGKDDTTYAGDYLPEQPLPTADVTTAADEPALCACGSSGTGARSTDTGHQGS
jgi:hypothetical protein